MASVWLCRDERLDRPVALKRLHADSPRDAERRFLREAKLGASMNHPNLVSVYDTETDDEGLLIVMEYVKGESLAEALVRGPLSSARVAQIARDLGEALDHVHAHGVVHRDVKPANVLLRHDGAVKLVDLGIAVSVDQTRVTRSGTVLGSAAYMAPEQLEGQDVGPAADVYALAAVCFEALAGRKARTGRTPVEIAHSVATTPPPDVREHAPPLPASAARALARGMARDPAERPATAGELAAELAIALGPAERPAPTAATTPIRTAPPPTAPSGRPRSLAGPLAVGLIALAVGAVVAAILLAGGGGDQPRERAQTPAQAGPEPAQTQAESPPSDTTPSDTTPPDTSPAEPPAADPQQATDPARGVRLNEQGFALMGRGDYAGAVPILRQAVASWPDDSTDINYAYALFNLGKSLNRSGSAAEAIPYLEQRLNWPNQRGVVKQELRLARQNAGQG
jgi:eukaryotic-like serine/threonine-protein kinase